VTWRHVWAACKAHGRGMAGRQNARRINIQHAAPTRHCRPSCSVEDGVLIEVPGPRHPAPDTMGPFKKRQNSERPGADRRNYSQSQSHLRTAIAMIGMKSPGLDGGKGEGVKTGTCSWGRAIPAYYLDGARCLTRSSSRLAGSPGWRPRFFLVEVRLWCWRIRVGPGDPRWRRPKAALSRGRQN
jgi:hypothetical protein